MINSGINPGDLREYFTVRAPSGATHPVTNEELGTFTDEAQVFGALDHRIGRETTLQGREMSLKDILVTIWKYTGLNEKYRLYRESTGVEFDILVVQQDSINMLTHVIARSRD